MKAIEFCLGEEMGRKCSHCGIIGHNSRTCTSYSNNHPTPAGTNSTSLGGGGSDGGGLRLFGVRLEMTTSTTTSQSMDDRNNLRKSLSMDCLPTSFNSLLAGAPSSSLSSSPSLTSSLSSSRLHDHQIHQDNGYLSGHVRVPRPQHQERKKGVAWTEEEHRRFLVGLEKLGKGDWRGISKKFVATRSPIQVASHAQKYFLRKSMISNDKKKLRASLFDMVGEGENNSSSTGHHSYANNNHSIAVPLPSDTIRFINHECHYSGANAIDRSINNEGKQQHCLGHSRYSSLLSNDDTGIVQNPKRVTFATKMDQMLRPDSSSKADPPPDLELTLAAPLPSQTQHNSSPPSLLIAPISVI